MTGPETRPASTEDLTYIESWLREEFELAGTGAGFWNNMNVIYDAAAQGRIHVLQTSNCASPVAFCACGRGYTSIDILEVHPDHRRQRHGSFLARFCIEQARQAGALDITVLCMPKTSVPFWKTIGFDEMKDCFGGSDGIRMRMVLT